MTYVVAWKNETTAFIAADAALTSENPLRRAYSTFGEKHDKVHIPFQSSPKDETYVEEAALKIFSFSRCAFAFSGVVDIGVEVANNFRSALADGLDPFTCLTRATQNCSGVGIIIAYHDDDGPHLVHYADGTYSESDVPCQIGSAPKRIRDTTSEFITGRLQQVVHDALQASFLGPQNRRSMELVSVLGRLQSYGIHEDMISHGIGGTFTGIFVDQEGTHWQPDILYLRHNYLSEDLRPVVAGVREDTLITRYVDEGGRVCSCGISQQRPDESTELTRQRMADARYELRDAAEAAIFDYVVFLSESTPGSVAVVELSGKSQHDMVEIVMARDTPPALKIHYGLWELINRQDGLYFSPFIPRAEIKTDEDSNIANK